MLQTTCPKHGASRQLILQQSHVLTCFSLMTREHNLPSSLQPSGKSESALHMYAYKRAHNALQGTGNQLHAAKGVARPWQSGDGLFGKRKAADAHVQKWTAAHSAQRMVSRNWTDEAPAAGKKACLHAQLSAGTASVERVEHVPSGADGIVDAVFQCIGHRDKCAAVAAASLQCALAFNVVALVSRCAQGQSLIAHQWCSCGHNACSMLHVSLLWQRRIACRHFVEIGASADCQHCAALSLLGAEWTGIVFDGSQSNAALNLRQDWLEPDSIGSVLLKHAVTQAFDFLNVDAGRDTWWLLFSLLAAGVRPRVIAAAFNRNLPPWQALVVEYSAVHEDVTDCYYGGSLYAFQRLLSAYGYDVLAQDSSAHSMYAVQQSETGGAGIQYDSVLKSLPSTAQLCWKDLPACSGRTWLHFDDSFDLAAHSTVAAATAAMTPVVLEQSEKQRSDGKTAQIFAPASVSSAFVGGADFAQGCLDGSR